MPSMGRQRGRRREFHQSIAPRDPYSEASEHRLDGMFWASMAGTLILVYLVSWLAADRLLFGFRQPCKISRTWRLLDTAVVQLMWRKIDFIAGKSREFMRRTDPNVVWSTVEKIPCEAKNYHATLSPLDCYEARNSIELFMVFKKQLNERALKIALSISLQRFPQLAGRFVVRQPNTVELVVNGGNGSEFSTRRNSSHEKELDGVDFTFETNLGHFPKDILEFRKHLSPLTSAIPVPRRVPLCKIKLIRFLKSELDLLCVNINHGVTDMTGLVMFLRDWSNEARQVFSPRIILPENNWTAHPKNDRLHFLSDESKCVGNVSDDQLSALGWELGLASLSLLRMFWNLHLKTPIVSKVYKIPKLHLAELREKALFAKPLDREKVIKFPSQHVVYVALFRMLTRLSKNTKGDDIFNLAIMTCFKGLIPSVDEQYFANASAPVFIRLTKRQILEDFSVPQLVRIIQERIELFARKNFSKLVHFLSQRQYSALEGLDSLCQIGTSFNPCRTIVITDWSEFDVRRSINFDPRNPIQDCFTTDQRAIPGSISIFSQRDNISKAHHPSNTQPNSSDSVAISLRITHFQPVISEIDRIQSEERWTP